jgi:diguanylate cyclase (GGDEF)-like protein/PAS domain S-box-containing protein
VQNEEARLHALRDLHILDTAPEENFSEAVRLAASICGTPIALINLIDRDRQWFKAKLGMPATEMPRAHAFCNGVIGQQEPVVVSDASTDARFRDNPFVKGDPNVRFYAGMPLTTTEGYTVGTLCVVDLVPHEITAAQRESLAALGRQVTMQIELRAKVRLLHEVLAEKERMESELRKQALLFNAFMDHSPTVGFMKDREGRFIYYNRMFAERFAITATEWIGKSVFDLFPKEFASAYHELDMTVLTSGVAQVVEESSPGPNNTTLYWRTHKFRIADGESTDLLGGLSMDISSDLEASAKLRDSHALLEAKNEQLEELSITDSLTGLRNRRAFDARLAAAMHSRSAVSLLMLDIDCFKNLNDNYGHPAGDEVLRIVAGLLDGTSRGFDCVARYGGEEFALLLIDIGEEGALAIAERLRSTIEQYAWTACPVTVSVGVANRVMPREGAAELLAAADGALYRAKHLGRNRVELAQRSCVLRLEQGIVTLAA